MSLLHRSRTDGRACIDSRADNFTLAVRCGLAHIAQRPASSIMSVAPSPGCAGHYRHRTGPAQHPVAIDNGAQADGRGLPQRLGRRCEHGRTLRAGCDWQRRVRHMHGRIFVMRPRPPLAVNQGATVSVQCCTASQIKGRLNPHGRKSAFLVFRLSEYLPF